jgi:hypothetical protein
MLAAAFVFVARLGSNIPRMDDWELVPTLTGNRPLTLDWLWAQHNEHRIPLARLSLLGLLAVSHNDFRAGMVCNVAFLGALSFGMIRAAREVRGSSSYADVFFPLALLHWGHADNLLWCWQVGFLLSTFLAGVVLLLIVRATPLTPQRTVAAGACVLLLPLCGANGLALAPALAGWLGAYGLVSGLGAAPGRPWVRLGMVGFAVATFVVIGLYFVGLERPIHHAASPGVTEALTTTAQVLAMSYGWVKPYWPAFAAAALALILLATASLIRAWLARPVERGRILGLLAFEAAVICLAFGIGWGRAGVGPDIGLSVRYTSLSVLLLCCLYFVFLLYSPPWLGSAVPAALAMVLAVTWWPSTREGLTYGRNLRTNFADFEDAVNAGVPPFVLADHYSRSIPLQIYPDGSILMRYANMMREAGVGLFRHLRPDPEHRAVPVRPDNAEHPTPDTFVLKEPRFVYAIRLTYEYEPRSQTANFQLAWIGPGRAGESATPQRAQWLVLQEPRERSIVFWVNGPVARFAVLPDSRPSACALRGIELLVPP